MINKTDYLKLRKILDEDQKEMISKCEQEQVELLEKTKNSLWGLTVSQQEYLKQLNEIIEINKKLFKKQKLKKKRKWLSQHVDNKIRIVFFCYEFQTFPTFQSVYEKIKNDDRFICDLVHVPFYHVDKNYDEEQEMKDYRKNGYSEVIKSSEYDLVKHSPDIAFFLKPYDLIPKEFYIDEMEKVIEKCIYIPYGMEIGATRESMRYQFQLPLHDKAWFCISYCENHYQLSKKYSKQKGKNYWLIGHPRMDLIHLDLSKERDYQKILTKAKGRKIFMWNSHFTIEEGDNWGTFKTFGMEILRFFAKNKNLFLLYRPHPLLEEALKREYKDNPEILEEYQSLLSNNKDNIYLDTSGNYLIAMHLADALISDANSFVPEFLIYNKPVIYTRKENTTGFKNQKLENMLYVCHSKEEIFQYINQLSENKDKLKKQRNKQVKKLFKYDPKVSVADKIINRIVKEFE